MCKHTFTHAHPCVLNTKCGRRRRCHPPPFRRVTKNIVSRNVFRESNSVWFEKHVFIGTCVNRIHICACIINI